MSGGDHNGNGCTVHVAEEETSEQDTPEVGDNDKHGKDIESVDIAANVLGSDWIIDTICELHPENDVGYHCEEKLQASVNHITSFSVGENAEIDTCSDWEGETHVSQKDSNGHILLFAMVIHLNSMLVDLSRRWTIITLNNDLLRSDQGLLHRLLLITLLILHIYY